MSSWELQCTDTCCKLVEIHICVLVDKRLNSNVFKNFRRHRINTPIILKCVFQALWLNIKRLSSIDCSYTLKCIELNQRIRSQFNFKYFFTKITLYGFNVYLYLILLLLYRISSIRLTFDWFCSYFPGALSIFQVKKATIPTRMERIK